MRTLILGDSQAAGTPGAALQAALERTGDHVVRRGFSGHGAADWRRLHWPLYLRILMTFKPERVVLIFGSNDAAGLVLGQAMDDFRRATGADVFYAGPPRYDRNASAQARGVEIRALAESVFGAKHLDAWPGTGPEVHRSANGLHFTRSGGEAWARLILAQLRDAEGVGAAGLFIGLAVIATAGGILWATLHP